ncbi:CDP-diacylglycerol diphosphatase [Paludibacterium purpuratum]|uniref:CDP-diacylglycerol pyrophosphatase n=1 Tax=Paludibacterium purpuratum TaxID=1144873 RepID=A0A4R7B7V6_9NEIS|nr:CDP-diacylglycerol diphosphatase [Paludibacterium purpuratum]TDR79806.1 CDP-diacylglycerol pyrophosphatase [Paludibacterium purpuratum]
MPKLCRAIRRLSIALALLAPLAASADSDALWRIVSQQCVPNQRQHGQPVPCAEVALRPDEAHGYVVFKDRNGPLQYLLMPTAKITGIESPLLLTDKVPDFFALAWQARDYMARKYGRQIDRSDVALAINSSQGRSQNQLHIHISCVVPALKSQLAAQQAKIGESWQPLPGGLNGHAYWARRLARANLNGTELFKEVADQLPQARAAMGDYTLAVVGARFADGREGFYLLADKADVVHGDFASSEGDVQDHACTVLHQQ